MMELLLTLFTAQSYVLWLVVDILHLPPHYSYGVNGFLF